MKPSEVVKSWVFWASVAFVVLVVLPLYAAVGVVAARTNLFDLHGGRFTDEQYKAIWAFLGVALGTAATIMGSILTKSNNDKNLAQQKESEGRQRLDTAVQALALIKSEEKYAPTAVTAGALATLVHLGHPTIAMRATEVAIDDGAVPVETAVWLIDQVLSGVGDDSSPMSKQAAAWLLDSIDASELTKPSGSFQFPLCAVAAWPKDLPMTANRSLLDAMIGLLVSRDHAWWLAGGTWTWMLYSIDELVQDPSIEEDSRQAAASYGIQLVRVLYAMGDTQVNGLIDSRDAGDIERRLQPLAVDVQNDYWLNHWRELSRWCGSAVSTKVSAGDSNGGRELEQASGHSIRGGSHPPSRLDTSVTTYARAMDRHGWEKRASLYDGPRAVGGRMRLETDRLLFRPHALDKALNGRELDVPLNTVQRISLTQRSWYAPRRHVLVETSDDIRARFLVNGARSVINDLAEAVRATGTEPAISH